MMRTRLTVELVPRTCWFSNVRSEVSAEVWKRIRRDVSQAAGNCCEICGGRGPKWPVECHEVWHYDDEARIQTLKGFQALCPNCHAVKHIGYASSKGIGALIRRHLAKVNGWALSDVELYLEYCFEVWMRRSSYDWKLDISLLSAYGVNGVEGIQRRPAA